MQVHAPLPRVAVGHHETVAGGLPRLREWETCPNSLQSTNAPPKFPTPNSPSPAPAIQVGYRAGTVLSPPPCRVLGVSWWRGPKSSQMLCQEPQTLVTSLILGRGLGGGPQLLQVLCWETPPHPGMLGSDWYKTLGPAGAGKQSWSSWWFFGCRPPRAGVGVTRHHAQLAAAVAQGSVCVQPSPGDTAAPRPPAGGPWESPPSRLHNPESQHGGPPGQHVPLRRPPLPLS